MFPLLLVLFFITSCASDQPCLDHQSVDISEAITAEDGSKIQNGVTFPPKYVYSKKVNGVLKTFGCLCQTKDCFRKCCPLGFVYHGINCTELPEKDVLLNDGLNTHYKSRFLKNVDLTKNSLDMVYGKPCQPMFLEDENKWFIQEFAFQERGNSLTIHQPMKNPQQPTRKYFVNILYTPFA